MSPERMKATGRVKTPPSNMTPPTISIAPWIHNIVDIGGPLDGKPKNFCKPCSRNKSAATIRTMLSTEGAHFSQDAMFSSPVTDVCSGSLYERIRPSPREDCSVLFHCRSDPGNLVGGP